MVKYKAEDFEMVSIETNGRKTYSYKPAVELLPIISDVDTIFQIYNLTEKHTESISDSARYKTLGNAVTVNVVKEIANIINQLDEQ